MNPHPLPPYLMFHVIPEVFKMVCIIKQYLMGEGLCFNSILIYDKLKFEEIVPVIYFQDGRTSVSTKLNFHTCKVFFIKLE